MRKFNGERIQKIMTQLNVPDDEPITAGMVTRSIEGAQRRVEGHNFDIRKHLLEYDDVMNKQRQVIYGLRRDVLMGNGVDDIIRDMLGDVTSGLLDTHADEKNRSGWNLEALAIAMKAQFNADLDWETLKNNNANSNELAEAVKTAVTRVYDAQKAHLGEFLPQVQKMLLLQAIDQRWKEHLQRIDALRDWINLRAYAQKDPLVEYKKEAFNMFEEMNFLVKAETLEKLFKIQLVTGQPPGGSEGSEYGDEDLGYGALEGGSSEDDREAVMAEAEEQLEALKPKRQRMTFTSADPDTNPPGGATRSDRRGAGKVKPKKRF